MFGRRARGAASTSALSCRAQSAAQTPVTRIVYDLLIRGDYTLASLRDMSEWFARPVLFVADVDRSVEFYVDQMGFTRSWRHESSGKAIVAQVERQGCELILSSQWPDKVGRALIFVSLEHEVLLALRTELEGKGVDVQEGHWGYRVMVVKDLDGNELYFPYPN